MSRPILVFLLAAASLAAQPRRPAPPKPAELPAGEGKETVLRVCGSTCHAPAIVAGKGYSRNNWATVVNGMIARGAKATAPEFGEIVDYLAKNLPPRTGSAGAGGSGFIGAGPDDGHIVDGEAAERGKSVYVAECVTCHGAKGRGVTEGPKAQQGADLVRSLVVLKDRYGATIGEFLKKGHPMQSGKPSSSLAGPQVIDLAHFMHLKVTDTLRSGPYSAPVNVLTGDAKAGEAYFNGAGGCKSCHSLTGDLAQIGSKYDPVTLQQKFLFPKSFGFGRGGRGPSAAKPTTLEVTPEGKATVKGTLVHLDDFHVALRDAAGDYHSWARTPGMKVVKNDPYDGHNKLLDKYTDKDIHNVVAYLEKQK